jgi:dihydropyrimidinase
MYDLLIKNAEVFYQDSLNKVDIAIQDGKIIKIEKNIQESESAKVIKADNLLALPGGIDSHVHISQPSGPDIEMADDFISATKSAAAGGNTFVIPFALQNRGESIRTVVQNYHELAKGNCYIDYSFHLIISEASPKILGQELPALIKDGYTSLKIFMTYDDLVLKDLEILNVMKTAKEHNALVMVHAEGYDAIRFLVNEAEQKGNTAPYYHAETRPDVVEREAVHRAISHAEIAGVPLMVVHVSSEIALEQIQWAQQKRKLPIYAETCPQYITLTKEDLKGLNMDISGAKYVCSPPPRDEQSQKAIWKGLQENIFSVFSSDHCPFRYNDVKGKLNPKAKTSFKWVPNGIPGVETRLPILFSEGVSKKRISIKQFVELTSTNHAKIYGLWPHKGSIEVGFDADIVLWDPNKKAKISQKDLHHGSDYTPWEGFEVTGYPMTTISNGTVVYSDGKFVTEPKGKFVHRGVSSLIQS